MKKIFIVSLFAFSLSIFIFQPAALSDQRTPTWDGWNFVIKNVYSKGMNLYVEFCNSSGKGQDGHVNITCNINGRDYVQNGVFCRTRDCKKVVFQVPDSIFKPF